MFTFAFVHGFNMPLKCVQAMAQNLDPLWSDFPKAAVYRIHFRWSSFLCLSIVKPSKSALTSNLEFFCVLDVMTRTLFTAVFNKEAAALKHVNLCSFDTYIYAKKMNTC